MPVTEEAPAVTLHPIDLVTTVCKICGGKSPLFGVVDFHKSCIEAQGLRLRLSGCPIYYRQCEQCRFTFTNAFDAWTPADFRDNIYNADYIQVDPDFVEARPTNNARVIAASFPAAKPPLRILDYGGGSGLLAEILRREGFSADTYDPFTSFNTLPEQRFDLITCFEVLEHAPFPTETIRTIASLLKEDGVLLFSTLLQPPEFEKIGLGWWYAGPRNGHVSLYSVPSLALLFEPHGLRIASFNQGMHIVYRTVPAFAAHLGLRA